MMNFLQVMRSFQKANLFCLSLLLCCLGWSNSMQANIQHSTNTAIVQSPPPPSGVELEYFRYKIRNSNTVILNWLTNSETMNEGFTIVMSRNNRNFTPIGTVAGFGTTTEPQSYQFTTNNVLPGRTYYKLIQTNNDGRGTEIGKLVVIIDRDNIGVIISPNPIVSTMSIDTEFPLTDDIRIMNAAGQLVKVVAPAQANQIDLGDLARGLYIVVTEYGAKKIQLQ